MKKLINGIIMVLFAVFMLISNADANGFSVYGTITGASDGTEIAIWRISCGGNVLVGEVIPDEDGYYEFNWLGKGDYLIVPLNDEATFVPITRAISVPQNKPLDFVEVE